jgi:hypothetical protein
LTSHFRDSKLINSPVFWADSGQVAQLVEQRTENPRVGGSIPSLATIRINAQRRQKGGLKPTRTLFAPGAEKENSRILSGYWLLQKLSVY